MRDESARFTLVITSTARRQVAERLPEAVAVAAYEFIVGPRLSNPYRVGKQLHAPLADRRSARRGTYRVIYRVDEQAHIVTVVDVQHRRDAYRTGALTLGPVEQRQVAVPDIRQGQPGIERCLVDVATEPIDAPRPAARRSP